MLCKTSVRSSPLVHQKNILTPLGLHVFLVTQILQFDCDDTDGRMPFQKPEYVKCCHKTNGKELISEHCRKALKFCLLFQLIQHQNVASAEREV